MRARLGFSIATATTPDILLLDEVLGTGDQTFRARSQARVRELVGNRAKAIVLVTHDLTFVDRVLQPGDPAREGPIIHEGEPGAIVDLYRERVAQQQAPGRRGRAALRAAAGDRPDQLIRRGPRSRPAQTASSPPVRRP